MDKDVATLGSAGRFVIPAVYRRALGVEAGDALLLRFEDGELRITTRQLALARARALVRRHVPEGVSLSDELVAERREASASQ
jgi:bifunctional DNA-binding transcriptional regulator/antitoxin component of YhaV-PrlF toxin-antitoxin module